MKENIFKKEIEYIKNNHFKENIIVLINLLPDYFFEVAASSTGKYHPSFALGRGGLVRHTKAAVRIAYELFSDKVFGESFTDDEQDMIIMALIMHDGLKHGKVEEKYTRFDHPLLMVNFLDENKEKLTLTKEELEFIKNIIESHMGPWNTNPYSDIILPVPQNKYQRFVHLCDYLASRKFLNITFTNDDIS